MTQSPLAREPLDRAVNAILQSQKVKKTAKIHEGGWRYSPESTDADTSVAGWNIMGLKSAKLAGIVIPEEALDAASQYIWNMYGEAGGFGYSGPGAGNATTAVGILCEQFLGHGDDKRLKKALDYYMHQKSGLGETGEHTVRLVLRDAGDVPGGRRSLDLLEPRNTRYPGQESSIRWTLERPRSRHWWRRTGVQHDLVLFDARSLLSLPAHLPGHGKAGAPADANGASRAWFDSRVGSSEGDDLAIASAADTVSRPRFNPSGSKVKTFGEPFTWMSRGYRSKSRRSKRAPRQCRERAIKRMDRHPWKGSNGISNDHTQK